MARFRIDYTVTESRHGYIEADSVEEARAKFERDGPLELAEDTWDDSDSYEVETLRFVCPKDGADVEPGTCCEECDVLFDEPCVGCKQAGYHAEGCEMLAYLEARAAEV